MSDPKRLSEQELDALLARSDEHMRSVSSVSPRLLIGTMAAAIRQLRVERDAARIGRDDMRRIFLEAEQSPDERRSWPHE